MEQDRIKDEITAVINRTKTICEIPEDIRLRVARGVQVRLDRHEGHETTQNADGTVTVVNDRLRVTLPAIEYRSREDVFTRAMRTLGNRSELKLLDTDPAPTEDEITARALQNLTIDALTECCRYNISTVIMRWLGGHRMSSGMEADLVAAQSRARMELRDNPKKYMDEACAAFKRERDLDKRYRAWRAGDCANWRIEILDPAIMPEQTGMCRYQEA